MRTNRYYAMTVLVMLAGSPMGSIDVLAEQGSARMRPQENEEVSLLVAAFAYTRSTFTRDFIGSAGLNREMIKVLRSGRTVQAPEDVASSLSARVGLPLLRSQHISCAHNTNPRREGRTICKLIGINLSFSGQIMEVTADSAQVLISWTYAPSVELAAGSTNLHLQLKRVGETWEVT